MHSQRELLKGTKKSTMDKNKAKKTEETTQSNKPDSDIPDEEIDELFDELDELLDEFELAMLGPIPSFSYLIILIITIIVSLFIFGVFRNIFLEISSVRI